MKQSFLFAKKTILVACFSFVMFFMSLTVNALYEDTADYNDMGCYNPQTYPCPFGFTRQACNFTGVYGPPYACQEWGCLSEYQERRCVQG